MGKSPHKSQNHPAAATATKGATGFEAHYQAVWQARWPGLKHALLAAAPRTGRANAFADARVVEVDLATAKPLNFAPGCHELSLSEHTDAASFTPSRDVRGLLSCYVLDPASVLAARQIDVPENSRVLDLCAAPGGKSLILAERFAVTGQLVLNDRSPLRRKRLLQVLKDYVPSDIRSRIRVHSHDGRLWGKREPQAYNAILLDSPCSSEQHVLRDASALEQWSVKRIQRLSRDQLSLLRSAFAALRPGGLLLYCTCALAPEENDGVLSEFLSRDPGAQIAAINLPIGEPTSHGWQILPDATGYGPLFMARVIKAG